jgi:hypothetical protein
MRHLKLFLAAAALLGGSVSMLRAESVVALNSADDSLPNLGASPNMAPSGSVVAPPNVPFSPLIEIAARDEAKDQPEVVRADPNSSVVVRRGFMPVRTTVHHERVRSSYARHYRVTRAAKRSGQPHLAALRASLWRGSAPGAAQCSHCWTVVFLGVGY